MSATTRAPASSHGGRGAAKRFSITQSLKGSATTGAASADAQQLRGLGDVGRCGRRNDPIDHRAGKRDVRADPVGERRIHRLRERRDEAFDGAAVARQIVAANDVDRSARATAARIETGDEHADRGDRRARMREVVRDLGMRTIEPSGRRVVTVTLLGHGERHDAHVRIGDPREHALDSGSEKERFADRADHARRGSRSPFLENRVQAVLLRERRHDARRLQAHAADAPAWVAVATPCRCRRPGAHDGRRRARDERCPSTPSPHRRPAAPPRSAACRAPVETKRSSGHHAETRRIDIT